MPSPTSLSSHLDKLVAALATSTIAVIDFETTGLKTYRDQVVGFGVYLPESGKAFYINVGHGILDAAYPKYTTGEILAAIGDWFLVPTNHLIAHNAPFELRFLMQIGFTIRCRTSCTLIHTHRTDENLREQAKEKVLHLHTFVSYGLKELTTIFFRESPPTLASITEGRSIVSAPVHDVATYCVLDCYNTWRLFQRAHEIISNDSYLRQLTDEIDDPNLMRLSRMMSEGILIDADECIRQQAIYREGIQQCRNHIWKATHLTWPLDTPTEMLAVLRSLKVADDIEADPFYEPQFGDDDPSVARDILLEVFEECTDPTKRLVIGLFISKTLMEKRLSSFLKPLPPRVHMTNGRLYPDNFSSTLVTTRFSSSPNLQNMPRKMGTDDDVDEDDEWRAEIPIECAPIQTTKNVFIAKPGHTLVSMDLSAAEPRYLALLFQRALSERDQNYKQKRKALAILRSQTYPDLLQRMRATAKPYDGTGDDNEIKWPTCTVDPLYKVFKYGIPFNDPYNALLVAMDPTGYAQAQASGTTDDWLEEERWRGKRAFLALGYGSSAENLYKPLKWTLERTQQAIRDLESTYATLAPLRELTLREMIHTGEVRSLGGRPRRINGYYQLARPTPLTIGFYRMKPTWQNYEAEIIPLGSTRQAVQAFVKRCVIVKGDGLTGQVVLEGDEVTGNLLYKSNFDPFANADHFNNPPFRNISFSQIKWVRDEYDLTRVLPRQARAQRQAFNALCQMTGADHLRWLMNRMDELVCSQPPFSDCKLVLTVHDSLIYEVPDEVATPFVAASRPVMETPPSWCDIAIKVGIEIGKRYGEMVKVKAV